MRIYWQSVIYSGADENKIEVHEDENSLLSSYGQYVIESFEKVKVDHGDTSNEIREIVQSTKETVFQYIKRLTQYIQQWIRSVLPTSSALDVLEKMAASLCNDLSPEYYQLKKDIENARGGGT
jgi:alpha-D-ribose 1-methylphosphonate 5-triphosphate synthase subunit PhnL